MFADVCMHGAHDIATTAMNVAATEISMPVFTSDAIKKRSKPLISYMCMK